MSVFFLVAALFSPTALYAMGTYRPETSSLMPGTIRLEFKGSRFSAQGFYDEDGVESDLPEGAAFTKSDGEVLVRYGFGRNVEFFGGGRFRMVEASGSDPTEGEGDISWKTSGAESFKGGLKVFWYRGTAWSLSLEGSYAQSAYSREERTNAILDEGDTFALGDAGRSVEGLGHLTYLYSPGVLLSFTAGYRMTPDYLSSEIPYRTLLALYGNKWALTAGIDGAYSMEDDGYSDDLAARPMINTVVTRQFNALNSSKMRVFAGLGHLFGSVRAGVEVGQIQSGVGMDKGFDAVFSLGWDLKSGRPGVSKSGLFKEYFGEAQVVKVSPRGKFLRIDKGSAQGVDKGKRADVFKTDFSGGNVFYASGVVYEAKADSAIVMLTKIFVKSKVEAGFTVRIYE